MTRLFCFGCSFTNYLWPTWADILARQFDQYYNYGRSGAGNQYIFNSIIEANLRHKFTSKDVLAIMWTNVSREDRYVRGQWITPGNIYSQNMYDKKFVLKFADVRGYYIRDLAVLWATDQLLEKIGSEVLQFSMVDINNPLQYRHEDSCEQIQDLLDHYRPVLDKILPSMHRTVFGYDWQSRPNQVADHFFLLNGIGRTLLERAVWLNWYDKIKDPSWPPCDSEQDFKYLPQHIQSECQQQFGYRPMQYKVESKTRSWWQQLSLSPKKKRINTHPTPKEHLEYLQTVVPDLKIDSETIEWVRSVDGLLQNNQDYSKLWIPNIPERW